MCIRHTILDGCVFSILDTEFIPRLAPQSGTSRISGIWFIGQWTVEQEALGDYDTQLPRKPVGPISTVFHGKKITKEEKGAEEEKEQRKKKMKIKKQHAVAEASSIFCLKRPSRIRGCGSSPLWFKIVDSTFSDTRSRGDLVSWTRLVADRLL